MTRPFCLPFLTYKHQVNHHPFLFYNDLDVLIRSMHTLNAYQVQIWPGSTICSQNDTLNFHVIISPCRKQRVEEHPEMEMEMGSIITMPVLLKFKYIFNLSLVFITIYKLLCILIERTNRYLSWPKNPSKSYWNEKTLKDVQND